MLFESIFQAVDNHPQNALSHLTRHEVDPGSFFPLHTGLFHSNIFQNFPAIMDTHRLSSPPSPEIPSITFYLVSPTHLSKQAQTPVSLPSTHHHSLYLSPNECRHCILMIFACFHATLLESSRTRATFFLFPTFVSI